MIHLLNHFSDHIHQLANLLNVSSELQGQAMMDFKQVYQHSNRPEVSIQLLQMNAQNEVFHYPQPTANAAK